MLTGTIESAKSIFVPLDLPCSMTMLLSSPYKGLMLTDQVKLLHVGKDFGVFEASNHAVYSGMKESVYLHGGNLLKTVKASIDELNPRRSWITLSQFHPLATDWSDRRDERVQPAHQIQAKITCATHMCAGSVDNISLSGLGVLIYHPGDRPIRQEIGVKVRVELQIHEDSQPLKLDALVMSINPISRSLAKVGLQIIPTRKILMALEPFVTIRRQEIFDELNSDWLACREPRLTKDLYF
jgi:hypothetical protein